MKKIIASMGLATLLFVVTGCSGEPEKKDEIKSEEKNLDNIIADEKDTGKTEDEKEPTGEVTESKKVGKETNAKTQNETKTIRVTSKDIAKESQNGMILEIEVPQIEGMKNVTKQKELNERFMQDGKSLENETRQTEHDLQEAKQTMHAEGTMNFSTKLANEQLISFIIDTFVYSGGAHGTTIKTPFVYDVKKDKELTLGDVFTDKNYAKGLTALAKEELAKGNLKDLVFDDFSEIRSDQEFYLTKDHLVLVFGMYEYTAGAAGSPEVVIEKSKLATLKSDYR